MKLEEIISAIEKWCPLDLQESWDNSGFQIKLGNPEIRAVLVSMEVTDQVISEAAASGAGLIICHHPLLFSPLKAIDSKSVTGNYICRLIEEQISVYASHTPFDKCAGGNNDDLAQRLHLRETALLPGDATGICRMGMVNEDYTLERYARQVADWLSQDVRQYRFTGDPTDKVERVALCTGSGSEFMEAAFEAGCDLLITGDVKYHTAQLAKEMGMNLLDIGHYGSEIIVSENMTSWLRDHTSLQIIKSKVSLNPFTVADCGPF